MLCVFHQVEILLSLHNQSWFFEANKTKSKLGMNLFFIFFLFHSKVLYSVNKTTPGIIKFVGYLCMTWHKRVVHIICK